MNNEWKRKTSRKAADFIDNCSLEDMARINAGWVAEKINVHPSYLSRIFREDYGCHLKDYIERAKMDKAQELLETTHLSVKKIAALLDYSNPGYFSSKFRGHKGVSPGCCRKISRLQPPELEPTPPEPEREQEEPLWQIVKGRIKKYFKEKIRKFEDMF